MRRRTDFWFSPDLSYLKRKIPRISVLPLRFCRVCARLISRRSGTILGCKRTSKKEQIYEKYQIPHQRSVPGGQSRFHGRTANGKASVGSFSMGGRGIDRRFADLENVEARRGCSFCRSMGSDFSVARDL